jgi:hypothetical protein
MTIGTQALQFAHHEGGPIALMRRDVIDLGGWDGQTQLPTMPANWLDLELMRAPIAPALKLIPISPSSRTRGVRIPPRSRHMSAFNLYARFRADTNLDVLWGLARAGCDVGEARITAVSSSRKLLPQSVTIASAHRIATFELYQVLALPCLVFLFAGRALRDLGALRGFVGSFTHGKHSSRRNPLFHR